jgi:hypothetical protein
MANTSRRMQARSVYVQKEYRECEQYWIDLNPGWQNGNDPGTHSIVEETKTRANEVLRRVRPCQCAECLHLLAGVAR